MFYLSRSDRAGARGFKSADEAVREAGRMMRDLPHDVVVEIRRDTMTGPAWRTWRHTTGDDGFTMWHQEG